MTEQEQLMEVLSWDEMDTVFVAKQGITTKTNTWYTREFEAMRATIHGPGLKQCLKSQCKNSVLALAQLVKLQGVNLNDYPETQITEVQVELRAKFLVEGKMIATQQELENWFNSLP